MNITVIRHALASIATDFVLQNTVRSVHYYFRKDLELDDPIELPRGKLVKVTIEYAPEEEATDVQITEEYDRK